MINGKQSNNLLVALGGRHFIVSFIIALVLFQIVAYLLSDTETVQHALAIMAGKLYGLFDQGMLVERNRLIHISSGRFVVVDHQCTGFSLLATLFALLVSLPNQLKHKIMSLICVLVLLQLENLIRINHLYYLISVAPEYFNLFHLYLWQGVNFFYAIGVFLAVYHFFHFNNKAGYVRE